MCNRKNWSFMQQKKYGKRTSLCQYCIVQYITIKIYNILFFKKMWEDVSTQNENLIVLL